MSSKIKSPRGKQRTVEEIIRRAPKMPPSQARRLKELLHRGNFGKLTPEEDKELRDLVDHVNRQTFLMLARAVAQQNQEMLDQAEATAARARRAG